jgi:hypothetical protein
MRWRVLFAISVAANLALGAAWLVSARHRAAAKAGSSAEPESGIVKTNVVVRRQFFSWSEVESSDYRTYIANLRGIGCPEQTIRDIIIADVNGLFARRLATEVITPDQQWWRIKPDPALARAAAAKARALNEERRSLLTLLLGPSWESGDLASLPRPSRQGVALDGPVLGVLPPETKQALQDASARAQERLQAYIQSRALAGKTPDPAELAKMRQQTRDELARVLTPQQLEEYLLRYSQNANNLRSDLGQLKYFDPTSDEFRAIFRATDSIDRQLEALAASTDPGAAAQRSALLQQRENAIKLALGADRYAQYELLKDPAYRDAVATAQDAGQPDAVQTFYQINLAKAQLQAAVRADTNLTSQQLAVRLRQADLDQAKANAIALGQDLPPDSQDSAPATNTAPPAPPLRTHSYVLGIGDSLATLSTVFGISQQDLQAANPGINFRRLKPGDAIQVPDSLQGR